MQITKENERNAKCKEHSKVLYTRTIVFGLVQEFQVLQIMSSLVHIF